MRRFRNVAQCVRRPADEADTENGRLPVQGVQKHARDSSSAAPDQETENRQEAEGNSMKRFFLLAMDALRVGSAGGKLMFPCKHNHRKA